MIWITLILMFSCHRRPYEPAWNPRIMAALRRTAGMVRCGSWKDCLPHAVISQSL